MIVVEDPTKRTREPLSPTQCLATVSFTDPHDGDLIRDAEMCNMDRTRGAEFTTPRRGLNGELVWLADELGGEDR